MNGSSRRAGAVSFSDDSSSTYGSSESTVILTAFYLSAFSVDIVPIAAKPIGKREIVVVRRFVF